VVGKTDSSSELRRKITTRNVDLEEHVKLGTEDSGPEFSAVLLVAGFIDVEHLLQGKAAQQLFVRRVESASADGGLKTPQNWWFESGGWGGPFEG